jgi:type IV secretory pathway VirB4 component
MLYTASMAASVATQQFVPIERVRDGIVVLKNGELRAVLITSSLNLSLKSEDEQQAILLQFQNLLNSLDFPIEFFIQSRRLNIKPYMELLEARSGEVKEDLLKIQIHEYMGFIKKFAEETNIMTKHFFIVIPYLPVQNGSPNSNTNKLLSFGLGGTPLAAGADAFDASRIQLEQRVATVIQGLLRFGLRSQKLGTEEVVELFYKLFNPGEQDRSAPKIADNQ